MPVSPRSATARTTAVNERRIRSWSRSEHPDGVGSVAVPVAGHRPIVGQAEGEGLVRLAGGVRVAEEPDPGAEHADRVLAVAVPVADERLVRRVGVRERHVRDPGAERVPTKEGAATEDADGVLAVAVPVADDGLVPGIAVADHEIGRT